MKTRNAKLLRQKKEDLKKRQEELKRLQATRRSDDCMIFIVAGKIQKLEAEIADLST